VPRNSVAVVGEPKEYRSKAESGAEVFRSFCHAMWNAAIRWT
jgi:hypothetical protein